MTQAALSTSTQRRRLYRWVAAVGLLAAAEDQRGADVPETNAMGLIGAHAACEAMLGLMIGPLPYARGQPADERYFPVLLELAAAKAHPRLSQSLRGDLMTMHHARNGFVHGGQSVDASELDRAIDAAHALAEHVPLPGHGRLVGTSTVVADIIQIEAVGMWLRHADEMRRAGRRRLSADGIARALDAALDRTVPRVRTRTGVTTMRNLREMKEISAGRGIDHDLRTTTQAIDSLTRWVFPLALGMPPATIEYVRSVVGRERGVDIGGRPQPIQRPSDHAPSLDDLRRATAIVNRIILRLWAMGSLEAHRGDDALVALAQDFLANPRGLSAGMSPAK
jgi:hypothetical protein